MSRRPSETIDQISDVRQLLEGFACGPPPSDVEAANAQSRSNQFAGAEDVKLHAVEIVRNAAAPVYYEAALQNEKGSSLTSTGALAVRSGAKTGRSPKDKRVVAEPTSEANVWWGPVNIKMSESSFMVNRERAIDYLNTRDRLFVVDACAAPRKLARPRARYSLTDPPARRRRYAGWDAEHRIAIRVVTSRAYHALFMRNMLVEPTAEEAANFVPDFTILNAGCFPANRCAARAIRRAIGAIFGRRAEWTVDEPSRSPFPRL
jgi:ATP-dependent phosphoenolpyruvate carboxykinase